MGDHGVRPLEDHDRPPLLRRPARGRRPIRVDGLGGLARESGELARVRSEHAARSELALGARRLGERVQGVGVDDQGALRVDRQVDDQPPGRAVPAQPRPDDAHLGRGELAQDRVVGGVADRAGRDLGHGRGHDLGALRGQDRVDAVRDQEADQAGAGAGGGGGR